MSTSTYCSLPQMMKINQDISVFSKDTRENKFGKSDLTKNHVPVYDGPDLLWSPKEDKETNIHKFIIYVNSKYNLSIKSYDELYQWSIDSYAAFWGTWWKFGDFISSIPHTDVVDTNLSMRDFPKWFSGMKLNFAENLLRYCDDETALYATGEGQSQMKTVSYKELRKRACEYAFALQKIGVKSGDRVVGYLPNGVTAVEAMLGTAAIGAVWSSTSPDFGVSGVLDRFSQIEPSVVISVEAVIYNGKIHDHLSKVKQVVAALPTVKRVIVAPFVHRKEQIDISEIRNSVFLDDFLCSSDTCHEDFVFTPVPFSHPLFIMFSSGTTGAPKCIVHSVGGTLVQITKELILHCDLRRSDSLMYYTTTGWMMWNWMVAGLFTGCSLVLYDGSPLIPSPATLWDVVDQLGISVLGTGAKWLAVLEAKGVKPKETHKLTKLRAILSTGSPLSPASFTYVYKDIKEDVMLGSISGGTDIISCFMGCNPMLPVYAGEIQCRFLGMAVESRDEENRPITDERGELVCTKPFPSMPTHFWNDHDRVKYTNAYFSKNSDVWKHGDYCVVSSRTGGILMLGRSDGTLNPNGVRFGSAEIYNIIQCFCEVSDSLCVAQRNNAGEERVVLFLKMAEGNSFSESLVKKLKTKIRIELSARHVPSVMIPIQDIPYTVSGKKVEVAVRKIIHGEDVNNQGSLSNPQSLDLYKDLEQLQFW